MSKVKKPLTRPIKTSVDITQPEWVATLIQPFGKNDFTDMHIQLKSRIGGSDILILVGLNGWMYKPSGYASYESSTESHSRNVSGMNVRFSMNGHARLTMEEWNEINTVIKRAYTILCGVECNENDRYSDVGGPRDQDAED